MWNRQATPSPESTRGPPQAQKIQGKYDWRLWRGRRDKSGYLVDSSLPELATSGGGGGGGGSSGSAPEEDAPVGFFSTGSHGTGSTRSVNHSGSEASNGAALLLRPGREFVADTGSPVSSHSTALLGTPNDSTFRHSRTTSVDSVFDEGQERCIHSAYRVAFQGDRRIKERPLRVVVGGVTFVLVERVVCGHSNGVYQKNKKVWEHVPRGQVRVFASLSLTPLPSLPSSPVKGSSACGGGGRKRSTSPNSSFVGGNFAATHTLVASLSGLRKFAHWGDASSSVFNAGKEVPVTAVAVEKADGVSCHVTSFSFDGQRYWVIGPRDRHLLVRFSVPQEDVDAYAAAAESLPGAAAVNSATGTPTSLAVGRDGNGVSAAPASASARAFARASMKVAATWRSLLREKLSDREAVELHQHLAERQWTLCFDAAVMGCERFVDYYSSDSDREMDEEEEAEDEEEEEEAVALEGGTGEDPLPLRLAVGDGPCEGGDEAAVPLLFYAVTHNGASERGLCLPVEEAMAFFERFHLPRAASSAPLEVNSPEYDAQRERIYRRLRSAGAVFYGANEQGLVVRLWKCRCWPYELERVAQEFIVTHRLHGSVLQAKLRKKLSTLSREVRANVSDWERIRLPFLNAFAEWLHATQQLTPSTDLASLQELRGHWVTAQRAFRFDQGMRGEAYPSAQAAHADDGSEAGDGVVAADDEEGGEDEPPPPQQEPPQRRRQRVLEAILLVGPQGCGKSTTARAVYALLEQSGCTPRWINQDEVGSRKAYLAAIHHAMDKGPYTHLILDKMNLDEVSRGDYTNLNLKTVLVVAWSHPEGADALVDVCFERVKRRGASHRSFKASVELEDREPSPAGGGSVNASPKSLLPQSACLPSWSETGGSADAQLRRMRGILRDCAIRYEAPNASSNLLELEVTLNCNATVQRVWSRLKEQSVYDLPDLARLDVEQAFSVAFGYESLMRAYPQRITAVVLQASEPEELKAMLPSEMLEGTGKRALDQVHVVLHNFSEEPNPVAMVHYAPLVGKQTMLGIKAAVADPKATLLHVVGHFGDTAVAGGAAVRGHTASQERRNSASLASPPSPSSSSSSSTRAPAVLHMAVLAKAKRATHRYCVQLLERAVLAEEPDPYVRVRVYPRGTCASFTYRFLTQ